MIGYDFDKTIYKTDSEFDFFFYMLFSRPYLLVFIPWFLLLGLLYALKILSKKHFKECLFFFIPLYSNIDKIVDKFWAKNANKIKKWYADQKQDENDVIISASLTFLIKPVVDMLNVKNLIATDYNVKTGKIVGENCYGEQKLIEFKRRYPKQKLEAFYSDSLSDSPIMKEADKAYLVVGNKITEIKL